MVIKSNIIVFSNFINHNYSIWTQRNVSPKYFVIKFIIFIYSCKNIFITSKYANKPNMRNILNITGFYMWCICKLMNVYPTFGHDNVKWNGKQKWKIETMNSLHIAKTAHNDTINCV